MKSDTLGPVLVLACGAVAFVGMAVGLFYLLRKRYFDDWKAYDRVMGPAQPAYRAGPSVAGYTEHVEGPPRIVQAVAFVSIVYGALGLLSAPLAAIGVLADLVAWKDMKPGFGLWFGPTGVALAITSLVFGIQVMKRSPKVRRFGTILALWTAGHNTALLAFGGFVYATIDRSQETYQLSGVQKAVLDGTGFVLVGPFVCLAFVYAVLVYVAVRRHGVRDAEMAETAPGFDATPAA